MALIILQKLIVAQPVNESPSMIPNGLPPHCQKRVFHIRFL
jgi:hypothetical protein